MKKVLRITALVLAVLIALSAVWFLIIRPIIGKTATVISSENYKINGGMMSYLVMMQMEEYIETHTTLYGKDYIENLGINQEKSLKKQNSPYGESWFSYFYDKAAEAMNHTLLLCETANDAGVTLTEKEIKALTKAAEEHKKYGTENVLYVMKAKALADKYEDNFYTSLSYDAEDYQKYYEENKQEFDVVDYKYMVVAAVQDETFDKDMAQTTAKSAANNLVRKIKKQGFDKAAEEYLASIESDKKLDEFIVTEYAYEKRTQFGVWAFSDERKQGDVKIFEGSGQFAVYYIEKPAYKLDYPTRQLQMITMSYGKDPYAALRKMRETYNKWEDMENTEENFKTLSDNVELENIYKENTSEKLLNWVYSDVRKVGDYELIQDAASLYLVRFVGESGSSFTQRANESLGKSNFNKILDDAKEKYPVKVKTGIKRFVK